ncbi:DNA-binding protein [Bradyrhizobium sp. USDA 4502]
MQDGQAGLRRRFDMPLKTTKFDVQDYLKTPDQQAAYLAAALQSDDPSFIAVAIGDLAKAREGSKFSDSEKN